MRDLDIHFQALCNAVENEKMDKIRSILDHNPHLDPGMRNADKISPLDVAFMLGNPDMLEVLVSHQGGPQGPEGTDEAFTDPEAVLTHLTDVIGESKKQVDKFGQLVRTADPTGVINVSSGINPGVLNRDQIRECEKQRTLWTKRLNSLRKMRSGFLANFSPQAPKEVAVEVLATDTIKITAIAGSEVNPKALVTKFKVQWSLDENFKDLVDERICHCKSGGLGGSGPLQGFQTTIMGLNSGQRYYFRVAFGNLKGYGSFCGASSNPVVASSWRSVDQMLPRLQNQVDISSRILDRIHEIQGGINTPVNGGSSENISNQKATKKKGLFQQLLAAAGSPKFQRSPQVCLS